MRTSPTQLPTYQELKSILSHEATRKLHPEKQDLHFSDYSTFLALLDHFNIPSRFFVEKFRFADFADEDLFREAAEMFSNLVDNLLNNSSDQAVVSLCNNLYDYLSEQDPVEPANLIFVFGSKSAYRTETAVRLYQEGLAPKILISGRGPYYEKDKDVVSEAESLVAFAVDQGIPVEDIVLEPDSITVPDNVKRSLNLLEAQNIPHQKIILVNSSFAQQRGWGHWQKFSDPGTEFIRVNTDYVSDTFSRESWFKNETGAKVVVKEFFGMRMSEVLNTS